jgi:GNAT superfamily N-acetyltransferase
MDGAQHMSPARFQVITPAHADYRDLVRGLTKEVWPEFMLHDAVANENWHELFDRFPEYQLALYDTQAHRVAGMANSFPLRWEHSVEELPEGGWDWAFQEAVHHHKHRIQPNYHCAIQIVVRPDYRSQGLSMPMVQAVRAVTESKNLKSLIIPIRPSEKHKYPLIRLDDYISWKTQEGLPFDPWLRVHLRAGARIIKVCHQSKTIRGTRRDWERWTELRLPQSGQYIIYGALNPIEIHLEKEEGIYVEPNVWIVHEIG